VCPGLVLCADAPGVTAPASARAQPALNPGAGHRLPGAFPRSPAASGSLVRPNGHAGRSDPRLPFVELRSEEHTSELQSREKLVCRLQLEKKNHIISGQ